MLDEASKVNKEEVLRIVERVQIFIWFGSFYYNCLRGIINMLGEESTVFPKQIKIDDYSGYEEGNVISILESSNLLLGSGARTTNTAVVAAKTLHYLAEEGSFDLNGKTVLDLGCGVGLFGVYLACLGCEVILADMPSMKDLVERNIGLNKSLFKGKADFIVSNWKKAACLGKCQEINEGSSTTSTEIQECLFHAMARVDLSIICEGGGLADLDYHLRWIAKDGLILCFMERSIESEQFLTSRALEETLLERELQYQKIDQYNPDYVDQRVSIYHIWK